VRTPLQVDQVGGPGRPREKQRQQALAPGQRSRVAGMAGHDVGCLVEGFGPVILEWRWLHSAVPPPALASVAFMPRALSLATDRGMGQPSGEHFLDTSLDLAPNSPPLTIGGTNRQASTPTSAARSGRPQT